MYLYLKVVSAATFSKKYFLYLKIHLPNVLLRPDLNPNIFCRRGVRVISIRQKTGMNIKTAFINTNQIFQAKLIWIFSISPAQCSHCGCNTPPPQHHSHVASGGTEAAFKRESDTLSSLLPRFNTKGEARLSKSVVTDINEFCCTQRLRDEWRGLELCQIQGAGGVVFRVGPRQRQLLCR